MHLVHPFVQSSLATMEKYGANFDITNQTKYPGNDIESSPRCELRQRDTFGLQIYHSKDNAVR